MDMDRQAGQCIKGHVKTGLLTHMNNKHCPRCGKKGPRYRTEAYCIPCSKERTRKYKNETRIKAIAILGGKCVHCGYNENPKALQIDHIHGGGKQENKAPYLYYRAIVKGERKGDFQLLCANCNAIKG